MKVYITGMGAVSSLGNCPQEIFQALAQNQSGVRHMPLWQKYNGLFSHLAAPAQPYDIKMLPRQMRRTMSPMSEMATVATLQALAQAKLEAGEQLNSPRTLIIMGSTTGSPQTLETYFNLFAEKGGPEGQVSTSFFKVMNHSVAANVASALGFRGSVLPIASACATSAHALIVGWEMISKGLYDVVIAGGADELHPVSTAIFDIVHAASRGYNDRAELTPRPFDRDRDGLVVSEGAGIVILESETHLKQRGARQLAEFCGGAYLCDGSHMSQSAASTMVDTMLRTLELSNLAPGKVDYVNAHATGTLQGDSEEAAAIAQVFGPQTPVSSLKAHFGHSLAACGALEVIASVQMMEAGVLIPTRNLQNVDPSCSGINHIKEKHSAKISSVLSNNFAFGGMNTSLLITAVAKEEN